MLCWLSCRGCLKHIGLPSFIERITLNTFLPSPHSMPLSIKYFSSSISIHPSIHPTPTILIDPPPPLPHSHSHYPPSSSPQNTHTTPPTHRQSLTPLPLHHGPLSPQHGPQISSQRSSIERHALGAQTPRVERIDAQTRDHVSVDHGFKGGARGVEVEGEVGVSGWICEGGGGGM